MTDTIRVLGMPDGEVNFVPVDQLMIDIGWCWTRAWPMARFTTCRQTSALVPSARLA